MGHQSLRKHVLVENGGIMEAGQKLTCETIKDDEMDCPRCGQGPMQLVHSSWYCDQCKYKEGCC